MKIQSKYKDYYDSVAHMYGGGDPKIYYERDVYKTTMVPMKNYHFELPTYYLRDFNFTSLVVGDKMFTLYSPIASAEEYKIVPDDPEIFLKKSNRWNHAWIKDFVKNAHFRPCEKLIEVTRTIGNPVWMLHHYDRANVYIVDHYVPLHTFGLARIYPAEQIYQDLSYFLSNKMKESPDLQPSGKPPQTDKEKVLAHGMDVRWSFRHRK